MGLKDDVEDVTKTVKDAVSNAVQSAKHDAKAANSQAAHHAAAKAEQETRESADSLSPLEISRSVVTQLREETLAEVDSIRQSIRRNI